MDFRPDEPMHNRYAVSHDFLSPVGRHAGGRDQRGSSTRSSAGSSTPARCSSPATRSTRSTTPTPAPTSRSPRCTTTSRGRSRRWCAGRSTASSPAARRRVDLRDRAVLRDRRRPESLDYDAKLDGLPRAGRRALRDRALPRVVRASTCRTSTSAVHEWVTSARLRPAAARDRAGDLPAARAGAVPRPLPRPDRPVGGRPVLRDATSCGISSGEMPQDVASRRSGQGGRDHLAGLGLDLGQVLGALERLGVDLVDVLGARRPGGEPGAARW